MQRHAAVLGIVLASLILVWAPAQAAGADTLPARLSDQEFWSLVETLSEPNGTFRSDNFVSNESGYQLVIPDLVNRIAPGGVYLGVGPEQNFPYIVALQARMAFIIDVRRGNLHEQLLYKALFEMSRDRAEFLSRLFSRPRPAGLASTAAVAELFAAYGGIAASEPLYRENLEAVIGWLTKKHGLPLGEDDIRGIGHVYHDAFFIGGPQLNYQTGNGLVNASGTSPTYAELMVSVNTDGKNRGYLASEESFAFLKDLESKNLLVPVVGNHGGPKAIRAVGKYVGDHNARVVAFYLSNVEQYLVQDGLWMRFCANAATLPLDETSTFIFSGRGGPARRGWFVDGNLGGGGGGFGRGGAGLMTSSRPMFRETRSCAGDAAGQ